MLVNGVRGLGRPGRRAAPGRGAARHGRRRTPARPAARRRRAGGGSTTRSPVRGRAAARRHPAARRAAAGRRPTGPYLSLRTFRQRPFTLDELVRQGTVARAAAPAARRGRRRPAGLPGHRRHRLRQDHPAQHAAGAGAADRADRAGRGRRRAAPGASARGRPAGPDVQRGGRGRGRRCSDLVRQALRMRPDRLVVGECRGAEVVDLLGALNTGHEGGAGTLHANTPADVPARLEALGLLGGLPRAALHAQVAAALQVLLQVRRAAAGRVLEAVCLLLPDRARAAGDRGAGLACGGTGSGPAAAALARAARASVACRCRRCSGTGAVRVGAGAGGCCLRRRGAGGRLAATRARQRTGGVGGGSDGLVPAPIVGSAVGAGRLPAPRPAGDQRAVSRGDPSGIRCVALAVGLVGLGVGRAGRGRRRRRLRRRSRSAGAVAPPRGPHGARPSTCRALDRLGALAADLRAGLPRSPAAMTALDRGQRRRSHSASERPARAGRRWRSPSRPGRPWPICSTGSRPTRGRDPAGCRRRRGPGRRRAGHRVAAGGAAAGRHRPRLRHRRRPAVGAAAHPDRRRLRARRDRVAARRAGLGRAAQPGIPGAR